MSGVLDLGYGENHRGVDEMFEHIDEPGLAVPIAVPPGTVQVTHPSTWGTRRIAELTRRLAAVGVTATPVPRALALARSYADASVQRCAVIETAVVPSTGGHWAAHLLQLRDGDWTITGVAVTLPADVPDDDEWATIVSAADVAVVDGPDQASIDDALRTITAPSGGVVRADRALLTRHGGRAVSARARLAAAIPPPPAPSPRPKAPLVVGVVACALLGLGWFLVKPGPSPAESAMTDQRVGPVQVKAPAGWERSDLSDDRPADGSGERAVFTDSDGSRIVVVVTTLRVGSTRASVAESLANRIAQRAHDAVLEFAPDTVFGGRRVISYRERPESGPPIAWYVDVERSIQTSVGCQRGSGEQAIDTVCADVVASLRPA
ncbi:type VII secretion-associated protein [Gordonia liuliyuniae]|uniref:Type VII secretion-associated protein n=1 Tax=Gordonia liuliyuniae TaxID=2911517 RepID=A0ABS9IY86_9ACTN|nr:type VII secretion-associated protein [Gordonia liuliyuniae]MCF8590425.1 type VII secretion-associated protein [Gordonia liuliyuniae]